MNLTKNLPELPVPQRRAIEIVREVAIEKGVHPYLVGGPVRDMLLDRGAFDIDLTIEQDSSTLARALAKRLGGRVKSFPQFLTYKVSADDLPEIDIATARKERYRKPGALPTVSEGKLRDDLLRRDFTVNAIAFDLIEARLVDPAGGERDVRERVIRTLHDASFVDDPTRIFRALRLAVRLGFTIEHGTAQRMRDAIEGGALGTVARERIWRELFLAMDEAVAPKVLNELMCSGALRILFGHRKGDLESLDRVQKQVAANPELDKYVLYTSALLRGDASPVDLEGSGFSQKRARNVVQIANELPRFSDALSEAKSERQRLRLLRHVSAELLSAIAASQPAHSGEVARFREFQNFTLPLRGNDLEVPGGPHVAKALERTREAVFTGEIGADDALYYAREFAKKYLDELKIEN
jgi:tRNA nucleotidyltransferase/poly(A) polymerase